MIRLCMLALLSAVVFATGCSRPSYINVPNDGSDAAINGPNWTTTIQIEKSAIAYLLSENPIPGDIVLKLPEGTSEATAFDIAADLAAYNVFPEGQTPSEEFHIVEIRKVVARGSRGRVDVIRPGKLRERELVEVHMDWGVFSGWVPDYLRARNIDVDRIDPLLLAAPASKPKQPKVEEVKEVAPSEESVEDAAE